MKKPCQAIWRKHLSNLWTRCPRVGLAVESLESRQLLSTWSAGAVQLVNDPIQGLTVPLGAAQFSPQTGNLHIEQPLDFRDSVNRMDIIRSIENSPEYLTGLVQSVYTDLLRRPVDPGGLSTWGNVFDQGGMTKLDDAATLSRQPALVYNSDTVSVRPIITTTLASDPQGPVPVQLQVRLTWNGQQQPWVSFGTNGHRPGDVYLLPVQDATPVTSSGVYPWTVQVQATLPGGQVISQTMDGTSAVVVNGPDDPFGAGWSLAGLDHLVHVNGGVLWVSGDAGGSRYFAALGGGSFLSPANDFGTLMQNGNSLTYTAKDQTRFLYDAAGRLVQVIDPHNLATSFQYQGNRVTSIQEPDGGLTLFTYQRDQLTSITEPGERVLKFTHDSVGDLTGITAADGSQRTFTYDAGHHLTNDRWLPLSASYSYDPATGLLNHIDLGLGSTLGVLPVVAQGLSSSTAQSAGQADASLIDALNQVTTYTLDALGREILVQQPDGAVQRWTRDFAGHVTSITDPLNHTTTYDYQYGSGRGDLVQLQYPDGATFQYQYDPVFHHVTQSLDSLHHLTTYSYNSNGDLIAVRDPLGQVTTLVWSNGLLQRITDPLGHTSSYQYDNLRRLRVMTDALGNQSLYSYDGAGNLVRSQDPFGRVTVYAYDGMRRLVQQIDAAGGVTLWSYNAQGQVTSQTDALGRVTQYVYDPRGLPTTVIQAAGTPAQQTTILTYDSLGRLVDSTDADKHTTQYGYDTVGRLTRVISPTGSITMYAYDMAGNQISETDPRGYTTTYAYDARNRRISATDALGDTSSVIYDPLGNVVATIDPRGNRTAYEYDALNRLVRSTDAANHTTTFVYDAAGNMVQTIDPLGFATTMGYDALNRRISMQDAGGGITDTAYDAVGNIISTTDPLGQTTRYVYDALDRRIQTIDARGGVTGMTYDAVGNETSLTDPLGNRTFFVYDARDRLIQETDPLSHSTTYAYDPAGRLVSTTDRDSRQRYFTYDDANRLLRETWLAADGSTADTLAYSYDAAGNLLTAANANSQYAFTYDALNRPVTEQEPFGLTLAFAYDSAGNRISVQDSLGGVTTSAYDAVNNLSSRQFGGNGQTSLRVDLTYTPRNQLATVTRSGGLGGSQPVGSSAYTYDATGRLVHLQHQDGSGSIFSNFAYTYDVAGRLTSETYNGNTTPYSYDATNQLTGDGRNAYSYDANGNRLNYQTGPGNQLLDDGTWAYAYDNEGNLVQKTNHSTGETWTYGYDNANRLIWAEDRASAGGNLLQRVSFTYDVFGNRIEKDVWTPTAGTIVTRFAYDGEEAWAGLDGHNALQTRYLHGDQVDQLFARIAANGTAAWYLTDRLGSVRDITDGSGVVQDHIDYDGFGNVVNETNPAFGDRYKYAGRELDSETGLQYGHARYYDPTTGRWISQDPLGFAAGDSNLYRYAHNSPTNATQRSSNLEDLFQALTARSNIFAVWISVGYFEVIEDRSSSLLLSQPCQGQKGEKVIIDSPKGHKDDLEPYLRWKLEDALISGCSTSYGQDRPMESIDLAFAKINWSYIGSTGDEYRRKVQFFWDREGKQNENSSCWMRVSQPYAGRGWGFISIPRIGQEVIVDFLEGDPDRPLIIGSVYNAECMPPYGFPE